MGLFSAVFGALGADKGKDRYVEALGTAAQALDKGASETEARLNEIGQYAPQTMDRLAEILLNGDMSNFYESPDYQYNKEQSEKGIQSNAAARGVLMSGRTLKELQKNASGLASNEYSNYLQRLGNLYQLANPYYSQYSEIPYTKAQNSANITTAQGAAARDATMSKYNAIGGGLDTLASSAMGGFSWGTPSAYNPANIQMGQAATSQPWWQ